MQSNSRSKRVPMSDSLDEPQDVSDFIADAGIEVRQSGGQFIGTCPLCGKKDKWYMSASNGLWDCKVCGEKGNIITLRQELGVRTTGGEGYHVAPVIAPPEPPPPPIEKARIIDGMARLGGDPESLAYMMHERGFHKKALAAFGVGMEQEQRDGKVFRWITFPWRVGGEWLGMKKRILPVDADDKQPRFKRIKGFKSQLYNVDVMAPVLAAAAKKRTSSEIILCSGETDLLSLVSLGIVNVVATTTGETALPNAHVEQLRQFDRVVVLYDNDPVGFSAAEKIANKIGKGRAWIARVPGDVKDANEYLVKGGTADAMRGAIKAAQPIKLPHVQHISELRETLETGFFGGADPVEAYTPWDCVNENLTRFSGLIVLSAPQNVGKTTFGLQICEHWARASKPALFYCLEMTAEELAAKIVMSRYMITMEEMREAPSIFATMEADYKQTPLYLGYSPLARKASEVLEVLDEAIERYQIEIVFFDNVHVIARGKDPRQIVGELSIGLKRLAMERKIPVIAIAQPRKLEHGEIMTGWDLKDSVDLSSDADNIILLHRQKVATRKDTKVFDESTEAVLSPYTLVRIEKTRFGGSKDSVLYFDGPHHRFRELGDGEHVEYRGARGGWKSSKDWSDGSQPANPFDQTLGVGEEWGKT